MTRVRSVFLALMVLGLGTSASGQTIPSKTGLPLPEKGYTISTVIENSFSLPKGEKLPDRVDLSEYFPPAGNQGQYASCTAWAIGYGIMTYERNRAKDIKPAKDKVPPPQEVYSPGYLFTMVKRYLQPDTTAAPCEFGVDLKSTMTIASEWGNVPVSVCGYDGALGGCRDSIPVYMRDSALYHKLRTPVALFHPCPGCPQFEEGPYYPPQWQYHLSKGDPILVGLYMDYTLFERGDSAFKAGRERFVWDRPYTEDGGPHAMVCCGYNAADTTFLFFNSYGTEWGNNGYVWVNHRTLRRNVTEAFVFNGGIDGTIEPPELKASRDKHTTDSTATGKQKVGSYHRVQGMRVVFADRIDRGESALVQLVDSASGNLVKTFLVESNVPRSMVIDDRLWTVRFTRRSWLANLLGKPARLTVEVHRDIHEMLEQQMDQHIDRFREK